MDRKGFAEKQGDIIKKIRDMIGAGRFELVVKKLKLEIYQFENHGIIQMPLIYNRELVDVIEFVTNEDGYLDPWEAIRNADIAWREGLRENGRYRPSKRLRKITG